jgi:hypothetical protein
MQCKDDEHFLVLASRVALAAHGIGSFCSESLGLSLLETRGIQILLQITLLQCSLLCDNGLGMKAFIMSLIDARRTSTRMLTSEYLTTDG